MCFFFLLLIGNTHSVNYPLVDFSAQPPSPIRDPSSGDIKTRSGMKISLVKGELAKQTVSPAY